MKNKKILPISGYSYKEHDMDAEFEKFLRESKEKKATYILKSNEAMSRPKFIGKSDKWVK